MTTKIGISEIFTSIDGEVNRYGQGVMTTFIRFAGCFLRCSYCDTKYAQIVTPDQYMTVGQIIDQIKTPKVTITGGEPLEQLDGFYALMSRLLLPARFKSKTVVTVETNGVERVPFEQFYYASSRLGWVIDYKLEYSDRSPYRNFKEAGPNDWVKIVINDPETDYPEAIEAFKAFRTLGSKARFALGFVNPDHAKVIFQRLLDDRFYDVTFNIQLHKCIDMK
jgi:7-carboxy-7-deazaguanine synthase